MMIIKCFEKNDKIFDALWKQKPTDILKINPENLNDYKIITKLNEDDQVLFFYYEKLNDILDEIIFRNELKVVNPLKDNLIYKNDKYCRYKIDNLSAFDVFLLTSTKAVMSFGVFFNHTVEIRYPIPAVKDYAAFWQWVSSSKLLLRRRDTGSDTYDVMEAKYIDVYRSSIH